MQLALIDGDILVYRIGFASEDEPESIAISRCSEFLENLILFNGFEDYKGYLTGGDNFRHEIAKTAPYKGNRKAAKPKHYELLREYMLKAWNFELIVGQEADDAMGIAAYALEPGEYCICTIDKDLDMIRGDHFNFTKDLRYYITEEEGIRNFYKQILTGDRVDNVIGIKGIGEVKAERILKECKDENEMYTAVLEAYQGDEARVLENGQLLWIRRQANEIWKPPKLSTSNGSTQLPTQDGKTKSKQK
jgi:5'-3' exonuclease